MRFVKKYVMVLTAGFFMTAAFAGTARAEEVVSAPVLTAEVVSGSAITEEVASGSAITGEKEPEQVMPEPDQKPVQKLKARLSVTKLQLKAQKTKKLAVYHYSGKVKWSSSKKTVATVSKDGVVTAKAPGDAVIIAQAGEKQFKCRVRVVAQKTHISEWVEKKGRVYYFDKYGIKTVGKKMIGGKEYYFDSEGRQRVGWVKLKGGYYYYNIGKKTKGYRVTGTTVNGIRLKKTGEANLTSKTQDKVKYLADANELCFDYVNFTMTRTEALKKMYTLMAKSEIISYYNYGDFKYSDNWDQYYASYYFERGIGDCYTTGCVFAYIATALGYDEVYAESSGGHGWCRIGEKYYDPNWASWGAKDIYDGFAASGSSGGKDGRVNWKRGCSYSKKVS